MSSLKIQTNNQWREFSQRESVPTKVLAEQFDWTNDDHAKQGDYSNNFFCYLGTWYHLSEFERIPIDSDPGLRGWQAQHSDSAWSGVFIKVSDCGEKFKAARFMVKS